MYTLTVVRVKEIRREVRQMIIMSMKAITEVADNTFILYIDQWLTRPMTTEYSTLVRAAKHRYYAGYHAVTRNMPIFSLFSEDEQWTRIKPLDSRDPDP